MVAEGMWADLALQPYMKSIVIRVNTAPVVKGASAVFLFIYQLI